jgi:hypothetical protein
MAASRKRFQTLLVASALGAALAFCTTRSEAQVNAGAELGVAYRASTPKLNAGFAAGAHLGTD